MERDKRRKLTRTRSTTDLTTVEFEDFCSRVRTWASKTLKIIIPLPNE